MGAPLFLTLTESSLHGGLETYSHALKEVWKDLRIVGRETLTHYGMHASLPGLKEIQQGWNFKSFVENLDEKPEFIFTNGLHGWAIQTEIPTFSILHGTYAGLAEAGYSPTHPLYWRMKYIMAPLEKRSAQNADQVISNSAYTQSQALEKYGVKSNIIHPPLNKLFYPKSQSKARKKLGWNDETNILFVGNPTYSKGIDIFLAIARAHPEWTFHAITSPKMEQKLTNVYSHAPVPPGELVDYYRAADVLIFPSRYEGFGFTPLEALACGCPIITSKVGIFNDFSHENAHFVEHDVEMFNKKLISLIRKGSRSDFLKNKNSWRNRFSPKLFAQKWRSIIREANL